MLAAAWAVAAESGAPLAASLRELGAALRDEAQLRREVAGRARRARSRARGWCWRCPLIAMLFGATLGFDTIGVLVRQPRSGSPASSSGAALLWAGRRWSAALAARATRCRGRRADSNSSCSRSRCRAAPRSIARVGLVREAIETRRGSHVDTAVPADDVIALAARAGAPVAELLRAEAARLRRVARADGAARAAALGVRLMLPLGACVLPAFVLLGVAPLLISVVTGTLGGAA